MKVIDPIKLRLNVNNKGYLKRSGQYSSVKNGEDEIAHVFTVTKSEDGFSVDKIEFEMTHQTRAGKTINVELDLSKVHSREDGAGGNGARHVNTWDGARKFLSFKIDSDEDIEEEELDNEDEETESVSQE